MNTVTSVLTILVPKLYEYFTKNNGLNTVTGAAGGSILTLVLIGMQNGYYDQAITYLQNNWEYGGLATAVMVGLRAGVQAYAAFKK